VANRAASERHPRSIAAELAGGAVASGGATGPSGTSAPRYSTSFWLPVRRDSERLEKTPTLRSCPRTGRELLDGGLLTDVLLAFARLTKPIRPRGHAHHSAARLFAARFNTASSATAAAIASASPGPTGSRAYPWTHTPGRALTHGERNQVPGGSIEPCARHRTRHFEGYP
jgi:hypothetical protein